MKVGNVFSTFAPKTVIPAQAGIQVR